MRIVPPSNFSKAGASARAARAGFTLTEFMVVAAIFMLVIGGVISAHLFGLRLLTTIDSMGGMVDADRRLIQRMENEIAAAKSWYVGLGTATFFQPAPQDREQRGNALQIYPTSDNRTYVRYYVDTTQQALLRLDSRTRQSMVLAKNVVGSEVFTAENIQGQVFTNQSQAAVIGMDLRLLNGVGLDFRQTTGEVRRINLKFGPRSKD